MYKLGQTLIFTLKSSMALLEEHGIPLEWAEYYSKEHNGWNKGFHLPTAIVVRVALDTEEKVQWFTAQEMDDVDVVGYGIVKVDKVYFSKILQEKAMSKTRGTIPLTMLKKIIQRNGKPFPTPQEVRHD